MEEYLKQLNESQREAVVYTDGPSLVVAGAGSGKTRVLTYKIAYLLRQGLPPQSILALTFTNKAAREMKDRIASLTDERMVRRLWMGTFHSVFSRILRSEAECIGYPSNFTIYDATDSKMSTPFHNEGDAARRQGVSAGNGTGPYLECKKLHLLPIRHTNRTRSWCNMI